MTIREAGALLRAREVSSVALVRGALDAAERHAALNAFITMHPERALAEAALRDQELARGEDRGPLHGIPIAHKDLFLTQGVRTTAGSRIIDFVPDADGAVVERLAAAGAVSIGKTNMHELAYGITSTNPHFGAVRNPHAPDHIPGGSSGGSGAAVAAGIVPLATGSDTGGSIRIPASYCGVAGLKPTYGRVSRHGSLPLGFSLDHMGPIGLTVSDVALALQAMAGFDPRDDSSSRRPVDPYEPRDHSFAGIRVGLPENYYLENLDVEVGLAVRKAVQSAAALGAQVVDVQVPDIVALNTVGRVLLLVEAPAALSAHLHRREDFGADVLALLDQGRQVSGVDYLNAQRLRRVLLGEFRRLFDRIDCLFVPTTPIPAPRIGQTTVSINGVEEDTRLASTRFVRAVNVLGFPALSLPCGFTAAGLPIGLQIIGPPFSEARLLAIGAALEASAGCRARLAP